jgi:hypothetical protein
MFKTGEYLQVKKIQMLAYFLFVCLFVILFTNNLFANNLTDKHVYGLFSENFNGATQNAGTVDDNIVYNVWNGDLYPLPVVNTVSGSDAKEGNNYYSCSVSSASVGWSGFCFTFVYRNRKYCYDKRYKRFFNVGILYQTKNRRCKRYKKSV